LCFINTVTHVICNNIVMIAKIFIVKNNNFTGIFFLIIYLYYLIINDRNYT